MHDQPSFRTAKSEVFTENGEDDGEDNAVLSIQDVKKDESLDPVHRNAHRRASKV